MPVAKEFWLYIHNCSRPTSTTTVATTRATAMTTTTTVATAASSSTLFCGRKMTSKINQSALVLRFKT